jgi:hypothetical protein
VKAYLKRDLKILHFPNEQTGEHSPENVAAFVGLNIRVTNAALHRLRQDQFVARARARGNADKWSVVL